MGLDAVEAAGGRTRMSLSAGTSLGPYEISGLLGAGGMGEVYRARDTKLDRDVAVKVLPDAFAQDGSRLARFEREARVVAALSHPNILAIFDYGTAAGRVYAVMELLDGETLRAQLLAGPLSPRRAVDYAVQVAHGLAAAHEKGIVHRDLKPENVFVTRDGRVKILDFGLAKVTDSSPDGVVAASDRQTELATEPGIVLGTVGYMAPEQITGQQVDARADIFALGAVLHEMLAGKRPFQRESGAKTLSAILTEDPPDLSAMNPAIAPGLERVVRHCLEKSPERRFHSAYDVALAIEALSSGSGTTTPSFATGRRRRFAIVAGAALVTAAIPAAYFAGRVQPTASPSFTQLTFRTEAIFAARFSPDGQTVVYSAAAEGNVPGIVVVRPDYPAGRALSVRDVHLLAVSSTGELAVLTNARYQCHGLFTGTLARMALGAEAPREILDNVREADWAPDGSALAVIHSRKGRDTLEFPIGTVLYQTAGYLSDVRVSPDGESVAFFEHPATCDDRGSTAVVDRSGRARILADGFTSEEGLAWSRDGHEVIFAAATANGLRVLHAVSLGGDQRVVSGAPATITLRDVSRDGRWLMTRDDTQFRIRGRGTGGAEELELTWLESLNPRLSEDGRRLLFADEAAPFGSNYALVLRGMDGSPPVRLGEGVPWGFSPDGRAVLAIVYSSPPQIMIYPTGAGENRRLEPGTLEEYQMAQWFPDGKRILVCGNEPNSAVRCYVQPTAGGPLIPVTPDITRPRLTLLSPDGRLVLAHDAEGRPRLYPTDGSPPPENVAGLATLGGPPVAWSADGRSVFARGPDGVPLDINRVNLATGRRERVLTLGPQDRAGVVKILGIAIARDGEAYAYGYSQLRSQLFVADGLK
jgi:eukaryotic-like serine/threonine-protein kinase